MNTIDRNNRSDYAVEGAGAVIRADVQAARAGDWDTAFGFYTQDIAFRGPGRSRFAGEHRGRAAAIAYIEAARALAHSGHVTVELVDMPESRERVALIVHERFAWQRHRDPPHQRLPRDRRQDRRSMDLRGPPAQSRRRLRLAGTPVLALAAIRRKPAAVPPFRVTLALPRCGHVSPRSTIRRRRAHPSAERTAVARVQEQEHPPTEEDRMPKPDSAHPLRRLVLSMRSAHARNSREWIRRMEVPMDRDSYRPR
jgi:hypothetical protein